MKVNLMNHKMATRMFTIMSKKGITSSRLCKVLNCDYPSFDLMIRGQRPCYGKWQKKIAEVLEVDRKELFREFYIE